MKHIAAIDLGTSKIVGMVARKEQEEITILAIEEEKTSSLVKRGYVHNVGDLPFVIKRIIQKLENVTNERIAKIYVNINGQSLRTEDHTVVYPMKQEDEVTQELLDRLRLEVFKTRLESGEIFDVVAPEYYIKNTLEENPVGITCSQIECRYKLIVGKPSFKKNIERCFSHLNNVEIAGFFVSPLATAAAVLSPKEKELGCALIEFGAGVTTLSVYKNSLLRLLVTIPFGGSNITKDILKLDILGKYAEKLKIEIGSCDLRKEEKGRKITLKTDEAYGDELEVDVNKLNECIFARENEIVVNVLHQLTESKYKDQLPEGIVIAGGASQMDGLYSLIEKQVPLPIRQADLQAPINDVTHKLGHLGYEQIVGMLLLGTEDCLRPKVKVMEPVAPGEIEIGGKTKTDKDKEDTKKKKKKNPLGFLGDLFGSDLSSNLD